MSAMTAQLLERKDEINHYLDQTDRALSAFSFTNIFLWQDFFAFDFQIFDDNLCVFARNETGIFLYLPPLGKTISSIAIEQCFEYMEAVNRGNGVSRIENVNEKQLCKFPEERFKHFQKSYEYFYFKSDLVKLEGNAYKSKRWALNNFQKNCAYEYLPYQNNDKEECLRLFEDWARGRSEKYEDEIYRHMLNENQSVHKLTLEHAAELGLTGRVIKVDQRIAGYTFGVQINPDVFCVLLEVADLKVKGLSVCIFNHLCADPALSQYKFINVMDDFEMENIQAVKNSFRPILLMPSYAVSMR